MLELSLLESTSRVAELEGPEEVGSLLEVGANSEDLMNQILHANNAVFAQILLNNCIVGEGNALLVDLSIATLVDELAYTLKIRVSVSNPGVNDLQHLNGGLGNADEDTVVDLKETQELENLAGLRSNLVDTLDTNDKDKLLLIRDVEGPVLLGETCKTDLFTLSITVLLDILLSTLEDDTAFLLVGLLLLLEFGSTLFSSFLLALALLQEGLGNQDLVLCRDGSTSRLVWVRIQVYGRERRVENCSYSAAFSAGS